MPLYCMLLGRLETLAAVHEDLLTMLGIRRFHVHCRVQLRSLDEGETMEVAYDKEEES